MTEPEEHAGYERTDAHFRPLMIFLIGLSALLVVAFAVTGWISSALARRRAAAFHPGPMEAYVQKPQGPLLEPTTSADLTAYRTREADLLDNYGWIDRENGIVRIPVERAMELILQRGLPVRSAPRTPAQTPPGEGSGK